jgi:hypothetical protein
LLTALSHAQPAALARPEFRPGEQPADRLQVGVRCAELCRVFGEARKFAAITRSSICSSPRVQRCNSVCDITLMVSSISLGCGHRGLMRTAGALRRAVHPSGPKRRGGMLFAAFAPCHRRSSYRLSTDRGRGPAAGREEQERVAKSPGNWGRIRESGADTACLFRAGLVSLLLRSAPTIFRLVPP